MEKLVPHRHRDVLIAIAEGRDVQFKMVNDVSWTDADVRQGDMCFSNNGSNTQWRVKPKTVRKWLFAVKRYKHPPFVTEGYYCTEFEVHNDLHKQYGNLEWVQRLDNSCVEVEES